MQRGRADSLISFSTLNPLISPKSSLPRDQNRTHKEDLEQRGIFQTHFRQKF